MIRDAGFDGAGVRFIDSSFATEVTSFLRTHGMICQAQCYPTSVNVAISREMPHRFRQWLSS
jgi:hypothetical protein